MRSVAIIGAGEIGGATARALAGRDWLERIVLVDAAGSAAAGKALDIQQSGAIGRFDTRVTGATDLSAASGCDVALVADQHGGGEWTDDEGLDVVRRILPAIAKAPIVLAGASQLRLLRLIVGELRVPPSRVLGAAPHALVSAARAMIAVVADRSVVDVQIAVVGVPGAWVPAWESATIGGLPLSSVLNPPQTATADRLVRGSWPPGPSALGAAAADCVAAMHSGSSRRLVVFAADPDAIGPRSFAALPARLEPGGIVCVDQPVLSTRERVAFESALELA